MRRSWITLALVGASAACQPPDKPGAPPGGGGTGPGGTTPDEGWACGEWDTYEPAPASTPPAAQACAATCPVFTDVTTEAGLVHEQYFTPEVGACLLDLPSGEGEPLPGAMCDADWASGGAAAGDYDGDGNLDLYVTRLGARDILYRNRSDGTFEDVTAAAGLGDCTYSNGAGWADVDGDGDLDLYVTTIGTERFSLYINDGQGGFTEQALARGAAIADDAVHSGFSVNFGDYDRDGWVDIHTTEWRPGGSDPEALSYSRLLRNLGDDGPGEFEDVTDSAAVALTQGPGQDVWAFGSAFVDLDEDGWPELAVVADFRTSRLFSNLGDGTFADRTEQAGLGVLSNGMGMTFGDYDLDGDLDWFSTAITEPGCGNADCPEPDGNRLFRNDGGGNFTDVAQSLGVMAGGWGWGSAFSDFDNDGDPDLVMTNGWPKEEYLADAMRYWRNDGGDMTELASEVGLTADDEGRGLLVFDYDGDGDTDLFVVNNRGQPRLFRNDGGNDNDWLRVKLRAKQGSVGPYGAKLTLRAEDGAPVQTRQFGVSTHYLGQSERIAHFGLGPGAGSVASLEVWWPRSGETQELVDIAPNQTLEIDEP